MSSFTVYKGSPTGDITKSSTPFTALHGSQALIEIHHAGLCGTDLHYLHADQVLGHEGAGVVKEIGPQVRNLKVEVIPIRRRGDCVGFGWFHDSCGHCPECIVGDVAHCRVNLHAFGDHELDQGGFATHTVWKEEFLYPIPDAMSTAYAAPLMCAGMTVFTPLLKVKPGDRVGVLGIGALGHLAIQFAAGIGADVLALSGTNSKKEQAMKLGAKHFVATQDVEGSLRDAIDGKLLDHLLITTSAPPDWNQYMDLMAPHGTIYPLTVQTDDLKIPFIPFLIKGLTVQGSTVGTRLEFQKMLEFAVAHNVKPMLQMFPFSLEGIAEAKEKMVNGELRYKAVLGVKK